MLNTGFLPTSNKDFTYPTYCPHTLCICKYDVYVSPFSLYALNIHRHQASRCTHKCMYLGQLW